MGEKISPEIKAKAWCTPISFTNIKQRRITTITPLWRHGAGLRKIRDEMNRIIATKITNPKKL